MMKARLAMGNMAGGTIGRGGIRPAQSMIGRRVRTVGAGLAYGGANCFTVESGDGSGPTTRLSRFDFGDIGNDSRMGITSGYDRQSSSGTKNEDWD